ncbi:MAG: response regulator [Chloroflexi bacterium]|nr:response regulator [Chloroflexota bacterium]
MADEIILIVEDNDVLRKGLVSLLAAEGYKVIEAANGLEALEKMKQATPDLILSDIAMPEMDGYALFEEVRRHAEWVTIPFIILTARRGREDIFTGKKTGAEDYLVKPVSRQELIATVRARLERTQQLLLAQLQQAYESSLIMLANAIELRDRYTRGHVERVRSHAVKIAEQLGWTDGHQTQLEYGSILHDIGKIRILENVLSKPGPLDDMEWSEMRKHPEAGVEMIANISYLNPALPVIRHHHERWDGRGYPDGLSGEAIPLAARIVAVADALDAMTISRSYRKALNPEQAYNEISQCAGTHFDPAIVRAFQRAWPGIRAMLE